MTMLGFTFLAPERLALLLGVIAIAVIYVILQFTRRSYAVRFTNVDLLDKVAPSRPGWRRHIPALGFLILTSLLVVAFARPATEIEVPVEQATIVLAIDTSLSMMATDVVPSRIDAAKAAAIGFLDQAPEDVNLALVSFNGIASVVVAPTIDRELMRRSIEELELGESTAVGEALFASLQALESGPGFEEEAEATGELPPGAIVLMSDGETTIGRDPAEAVAAAQEIGVPVSTIAFGTVDGIIEIPQEPFPIPVPVKEAELRDIADRTNGKFFTAESASELESIYTDIGTAIGFETDDREIGSWFVGLALLFALLTSATSLIWFSRLP